MSTRLQETPNGSAFEPISMPSLADSVVAQIRRAIVNGTMSPGERLVETELAEQFQVSRATVRQALSQLRLEGLVEIRPRRGALVTRMSSQAAQDVCVVRGLLEGWAARTACQTLSDPEFDRMRGIAEDMGASVRRGDVYHVVELDIALHSSICRVDANPYLVDRWQSLNTLHGALLSSRLAFYNYDPIGIVQRHLDLIDTLTMRDESAAEAAVRKHYIAPFLEGGFAENPGRWAAAERGVI